MRLKKHTARLVSLLLVVCLLATTALAYDGIYTDKHGNIRYQPYEEGIFSDGGYTIDKVSHPTLGAGEVDGILTGENRTGGRAIPGPWQRPETIYTLALVTILRTTSITTM